MTKILVYIFFNYHLKTFSTKINGIFSIVLHNTIQKKTLLSRPYNFKYLNRKVQKQTFIFRKNVGR